MRYHEYAPHAVLHDCIKCLWILEKEYTPDDGEESVVPDACIELILNVGAPYRHVGSGGERELPQAVPHWPARSAGYLPSPWRRATRGGPVPGLGFGAMACHHGPRV